MNPTNTSFLRGLSIGLFSALAGSYVVDGYLSHMSTPKASSLPIPFTPEKSSIPEKSFTPEKRVKNEYGCYVPTNQCQHDWNTYILCMAFPPDKNDVKKTTNKGTECDSS